MSICICELKGVHIATFEAHLFSSNVEHCSISNVDGFQCSCKRCCPIAAYAMCYSRVFPYVQIRVRDALFRRKRKKKDAKHQREPVLSDAHVLER